MNDTLDSCITAEVCEQASPADLYPVLDGNCDHNILQLSDCGDDHVTMDSQKVLINYITIRFIRLPSAPLLHFTYILGTLFSGIPP